MCRRFRFRWGSRGLLFYANFDFNDFGLHPDGELGFEVIGRIEVGSGFVGEFSALQYELAYVNDFCTHGGVAQGAFGGEILGGDFEGADGAIAEGFDLYGTEADGEILCDVDRGAAAGGEERGGD